MGFPYKYLGAKYILCSYMDSWESREISGFYKARARAVEFRGCQVSALAGDCHVRRAELSLCMNAWYIAW